MVISIRPALLAVTVGSALLLLAAPAAAQVPTELPSEILPSDITSLLPSEIATLLPPLGGASPSPAPTETETPIETPAPAGEEFPAPAPEAQVEPVPVGGVDTGGGPPSGWPVAVSAGGLTLGAAGAWALRRFLLRS